MVGYKHLMKMIDSIIYMNVLQVAISHASLTHLQILYRNSRPSFGLKILARYPAEPETVPRPTDHVGLVG